MKKHLVFLLVLLLLCGSVVSCQKETDPESSSTDNITTAVPQTTVSQTTTSAPGAESTTADPAAGTDATTSPVSTASPEVTTDPASITTAAITAQALTDPIVIVTEPTPVTTAAIPQHTHAFGSAWVSDNTNHWHACSCGQKSGTAAHTFGEWITDSEATCTAAGARHHVCTACGKSVSEAIPAKGHTPVTDAGTPATCTSSGLTDGTHCSVCQAVLTAQSPISAKGHTPVTDAAVSPTCTETGLTEGSHCSVCSAVLTAQQEVEALGHNYVNDVCTRCGRSRFSSGFTYRESDYGDGWNVTGLGTCTDVEIVFPPEYQGKPILEIGDNFCKNQTQIKSVTIPDTVVRIGANAFYGCTGLTEFVVPSSVIVLADGALYGCTEIKELTVPASVSYIGVDTIKNSGIETLYYYSDCRPLNNQMANIKKAVFGGTLVPDHLFENATQLTEVTFVSNITRIGVSAFAGCSSLASIQIPTSVKNIYQDAFNGCSSLKSVEFPDNIRSVEIGIFKNCSSLEIVYMPGKLELVRNGAFEGCTNLKTINYTKRTDQWQYEVMKNSGWDTNTGNFEVVCSNGTLTKTQAEINY